jgi:hypothetical protein
MTGPSVFDQPPRLPPPTEPAADLRAMASVLWQTYVALTAEGFNERQALRIIADMLSAVTGQVDE